MHYRIIERKSPHYFVAEYKTLWCFPWETISRPYLIPAETARSTWDTKGEASDAIDWHKKITLEKKTGTHRQRTVWQEGPRSLIPAELGIVLVGIALGVSLVAYILSKFPA